MSEKTKIEWADSTLNLMMGCDGCELWSQSPGGTRTCYAGNLTAVYAGGNGWPQRFGKPKVFPYRVRQAVAWGDLTGWTRETKPWLGAPPRLVFLDDMGDTFTESLDPLWILEHLPTLERTPHRYLMLTKRPHRMAQAFEAYGRVPRNVWPGVTVTSRATLRRVDRLMQIGDEKTLRWVSAEPMLEELPELERAGLDWIVYGGESDNGKSGAARPFDAAWIHAAIGRCREHGIAPFVKQVGSEPRLNGSTIRKLISPKGGDWNEWPEWARVREMPANDKVFTPTTGSLFG